jgi:hypothetical protein
MAAHTTHSKHSLSLDKVLGEKKVELDGREQDLAFCEVALAEVQARGHNPRDDHEELMELIELWRLLQDAEADRFAEVGRLAILVRDVSKVLVDLGMPPIPGIPWNLCMTGNLLGAVDIILEHLRKAYTSDHDPWD